MWSGRRLRMTMVVVAEALGMANNSLFPSLSLVRVRGATREGGQWLGSTKRSGYGTVAMTGMQEYSSPLFPSISLSLSLDL